MGRVKASSSPIAQEKIRPAITPEARENQMIALAMDRAEEQLRDGTASSQVITHFLKLATAKAKLEMEILEKQKLLVEAKTESMQSGKRLEALYQGAIDAMREYGSGITSQSNEEEYDEE